MQMSLFAGDKLQVLDLALNPALRSDRPKTSVLDHVRECCHSLRDLIIHDGDKTLSDSLSALVASKPHLQRLSAKDIPLSLDCILSLRSPHRLNVTLTESSLTYSSSVLPGNLFSVLRVLEVNVDPSLGLSLLEHCHTGSL